MGAVQSNQTEQEIKSLSNIVNSVVTKITNNATSNCSASNDVNIVFGGINECGIETKVENSTINTTQRASCYASLDNTNINSLTTQITDNVKTALSQHIDQSAQSKNGWFAVAFSVQVEGAKNTQEVMTQINNSFNSNFLNNCKAIATAYNNKKLLFCGAYNNVTFNLSQDAAATAISSCINKNIIDIFTSNTVLNELVQKTEQKLASQNEGLDLKWLWITLGVVVGIVFLILLIWFITKISHKSKGGTKIAVANAKPVAIKSAATKTVGNTKFKIY